MHRTTILRTALAVVAAGSLAACSEVKTTTTAAAKPATLEKIEGTDRSKIVVVEKAAKRIDLQTAPIREASALDVVAVIGASPPGRAVLPYTALLYDKTGATFTYVSTAPLEFEHQAVTVERIKADWVVLAAGPPTGTAVVTRGGAELFGVETGVGK